MTSCITLCWVSCLMYRYAECRCAECHYVESRGAQTEDWGKEIGAQEKGG